MKPYFLLSVTLFILHWVLMIGGRKELKKQDGDKNYDPLYRLWTLIPASLGLFTVQLAGVFSWYYGEPTIPLSQAIIAAILFFVGFTLRAWSMRILGRLFTFDIGIRSGHKILKEGPYAYIRHPSYTGYFVMLWGLCLSYPYPYFFPLLGIPTLIFFLLRIHSEEKMLLSHFGEDYRTYQSETKKLVPFIY